MPYPAEARFVCHIMGANQEVAIDSHNGKVKARAHFDNELPLIRRIFAVAPAPAGTVANDDIDECISAAKKYLQNELPSGYTIDETPAHAIDMRGHAWRDGQWVPTHSAYVGYAFRLQFDGENVERHGVCEKVANTDEQSLIFRWYVHVQPQ